MASRNANKLLKHAISADEHFIFTFPMLIHPNIANLKMKDLVHLFRSEFMVYDIEKTNGIVFNLTDVLQCGMFGICGISSSFRELCKLMDTSINILRNQIINFKDAKNILNESRTDLIELVDIFGKVKMFLKGVSK